MLKRTLFLAGALALCCAFSTNDDIHARLIRLETLMNMVLQHLGLDPNDALSGPSAAVRTLILANNKIEAIKVYREQTGVGLKEAKDAVDALERQMRGY